MLAPFRHHFHPLEWVTALSADRSARALHVLSAAVYVLLALLVCMQILSCGAVQRIASPRRGPARCS